MFWRFDELFSKKLQKPPHFMKKHENSSIWPKLCNFFEQSTMFWCLDELFSKRLQKAAHFVKKHEKTSIWPKLCNFSNKLPCLCISMNFSGKSYKKGLISWKRTKNHRFGQNFATFRTNYHVFAFRWTFQEKVAKSASFREKARKTIDLAKTCIFWSKLPCFGIFMNFSARSCKKCLISWKSTRNHRFGQNYATFRTNYHVFAFRWTFKEKVGKSGSFREKARKIMDLVKTCNFFKTLPCFDVSMNFSAKSCKSCLISWKSTKNHRFGQNFATFRTNYHAFAFRSTFQEKVAKSASFREKARKTIDLAKTCIFWSKLPCFGIFMNFSARSCKKCLISWKSTRNHRFGQNYATFRTNYHVFAFRWTFKEKVGKSGSFREKARKIMDLVKTCNFLKTLPCFDVSMNFSAKGCKKWLNSWKTTKNHRFGQNFATFRTNYHVFAFRWTFQEKVTKRSHFVKKHEKSSIWPKLCNFSNKLPCLCISMNFSGKSCKKCLISWKSTENHRLGQNLHVLEQTTMFWHFHELFSKKLQKVPHFVKKHEKSSIWPKLCNFSDKLLCFCISMNF